MQQRPVPDVSPQLGSAPSLADVSLAAALAPLFSTVLGAAARKPYGPVAAWLEAYTALPAVEKAMGGCWRGQPASWARAGSLGIRRAAAEAGKVNERVGMGEECQCGWGVRRVGGGGGG
jgi:hypothetical protein